jgi:hypothetical protein
MTVYPTAFTRTLTRSPSAHSPASFNATSHSSSVLPGRTVFPLTWDPSPLASTTSPGISPSTTPSKVSVSTPESSTPLTPSPLTPPSAIAGVTASAVVRVWRNVNPKGVVNSTAYSVEWYSPE